MRNFLLTFFAAVLCAVSMLAAPAVAINGKLPGAFTINSDGDQVYFSQGNLQATTSNYGVSWTWSFAENQWDYVGNATANTAIDGNGSVSTDGVPQQHIMESTAARIMMIILETLLTGEPMPSPTAVTPPMLGVL